MKEEFIVCGHSFNTEEISVKYRLYIADLLKKRRHEWPLSSVSVRTHVAEMGHFDLPERFSELLKRFHLPPDSELRFTDYGIPRAAYERCTSKMGTRHMICIDTTLLTLLDPLELDAVLAHEMAHVQQKADTFANREREADRRAGEVTGSPEALASALQKIEDYTQALKKASPEIAVVSGLKHLGRQMKSVLLTGRSKLHPPTYSRIQDLTFGERARFRQRRAENEIEF